MSEVLDDKGVDRSRNLPFVVKPSVVEAGWVLCAPKAFCRLHAPHDARTDTIRCREEVLKQARMSGKFPALYAWNVRSVNSGTYYLTYMTKKNAPHHEYTTKLPSPLFVGSSVTVYPPCRSFRQNPESLLVFAAGNKGGQSEDICSITSPGTGKNALTVGTSSSGITRFVAGLDIDEVSYFSGRGPLLDGRIKPDVSYLPCSVRAWIC